MIINAQTIGGVAIAAVLGIFALTGSASGGSLFANTASAGYGGQDKVLICHKDKKTINVATAAVTAHLNHGDYLGACENVDGDSLKDKLDKKLQELEEKITGKKQEIEQKKNELENKMKDLENTMEKLRKEIWGNVNY